jgi:tetratricopeptide (TPR) repeat protein
MQNTNYSNVNLKKMELFLVTIAAVVMNLSASNVLAEAGSAMTWDQTQKAGSEALDRNLYGVAEPLLKQAVIKGASFGEADLRLAKSLDELGRLYTVRGRFADAEPLLEEALHVKQMAIGKNSGDIIPAMSSLVQFYLAHGTASKAEPLTEDIILLLEGKMGEYNSQPHGVIKYRKGQPLTGWAGSAADSARQPLIEWAIAVDAMADAYRACGELELAERLYKAALDVKTTVLGKQHLSLANSYDGLGSICFEDKKYLDAEAYLKDAYDITEKILPPDNPKVFYRLDKLCTCLIAEEKYADAEQLYVHAQTFFKGSPLFIGTQARAAYALGSLYVREKKYANAVPILQRALQLAEVSDGIDSIDLVPYLRRYADALYYLGDREQTGQLRSRANTIIGADSG